MLEPSYRTGAQFLAENTGQNALSLGITRGDSATIRGTDPAGYVQDRLALIPSFGPNSDAPGWLSSVGRGLAGGLVALILVAVGVWVIYRQ